MTWFALGAGGLFLLLVLLWDGERRRSRRFRQLLEVLREASARLMATTELEPTLRALLDNLVRLFSGSHAAIVLLDEEGKELVLAATTVGQMPPGTRFSVEEGVTGWVVRHGQPLRIDDVRRDPRYLEAFPGTRSELAVPIWVEGQVIGALDVESPQAGAFTAEDQALLEAVAELAGAAIQRARLYEQLKRMALTDPLTGLYNRRYLNQRLSEELSRARRYGFPLAVLICDLVGFKRVNDRLGHAEGDRILQRVAQVLREGCRRGGDVVARMKDGESREGEEGWEEGDAFRFGGDEFVILLPHADRIGGRIAALRLYEAISRLDVRTSEGERIPLAANFGVVAYPEDGEAMERLLNLADACMYYAKARGLPVATREDLEKDETSLV